MTTRNLQIFFCFLLSVSFGAGGVYAKAGEQPDIKELKAQYDRNHLGKGKHGNYWDPIPIQKYWNPKDFYKPPATVPQAEVTRAGCVQCHERLTPGAYHAWRSSTHANLDKIRRLPENVSRSYKRKRAALDSPAYRRQDRKQPHIFQERL